MNILYTCDNNYVWLMGISMTSLFENNRDLANLTVFLLGEKISTDNKEKLCNIAKKYDRNCVIIDMPSINIPPNLMSKRWPLSAFSRLYAVNYLPKDVENILYLDCDTIILDSLKKIDDVQFNDYLIYGKKDCISKNYKKNIGLTNDEIYVNGGVLLMNCTELRKIDISNAIENYLNDYESYIHYADQDLLNGIFKGKIGVLPANYDVMTIECMNSYKEIRFLRKPDNYYSEEEFYDSINNPIIVHFTTNMYNIRPWYDNSNHKFKEEFMHYKLLTPWENKSLGTYIENNTIKLWGYRVMKIFPKSITYPLFGFIHSMLFPKLLKYKTIFKRKKSI